MEDTKINLTEKQIYALAAYVAEYIQEEKNRGLKNVNAWIIQQAIDAYKGGAR